MNLFCYLMDIEAMGDLRGPSTGLADFAARARQSGFRTLRLGHPKRVQRLGEYNKVSEDSSEGVEDSPTEFHHAILGVVGELGVRLPTAEFAMVHVGLKVLSEGIGWLKGEVALQGFGLKQSRTVLSTVCYETAEATALSREAKCWKESMQGIGGVEDIVA